ncbi:MAG TPA: hypothetical protein VF824_09150 [Thermoanaerobaculia bacterium]|jgi:hypothetical protein
MRSTRLLFLLIAAIALLHAAAAHGAGIDMNDPRRALGREDNVRVDAQLVQETVSPGAPIGVTYQVQNLGDEVIALADRVSDASYDEDSRTITVAIGSEIPADGRMPHLVSIAPGQTKVFRTAAVATINAAAVRSSLVAPPRYVQVKVTVLRDLASFEPLTERRALSDQLFDHWLESNDTIFLNSIPVQWSARPRTAVAEADQRGTY